jgi:hypothetical protein
MVSDDRFSGLGSETIDIDLYTTCGDYRTSNSAS